MVNELVVYSSLNDSVDYEHLAEEGGIENLDKPVRGFLIQERFVDEHRNFDSLFSTGKLCLREVKRFFSDVRHGLKNLSLP